MIITNFNNINDIIIMICVVIVKTTSNNSFKHFIAKQIIILTDFFLSVLSGICQPTHISIYYFQILFRLFGDISYYDCPKTRVFKIGF